MTANEIIELLELEPLRGEGGYFRRTFESKAVSSAGHFFSTAIYYLVTPESFSSLHRLPQEELFHFYLGDPVEMLQLTEDGRATRHHIGPDLRAGQRPQLLAPGNVWQGTRLLEGGKWALLGTTVTPGFRWEEYEIGSRDALCARYPIHRLLIERFTLESNWQDD
jgi:predicted cupin superfamily sugar epimerase